MFRKLHGKILNLISTHFNIGIVAVRMIRVLWYHGKLGVTSPN